MALTANIDRDHTIDQSVKKLKIKAAKRIYQGALLTFDAGGFVEPAVIPNVFAGMAYEEIDNTSGADGALSVRLYVEGDFTFTLAGATLADIGAAVYATDDGTLSLTSTGNTFVGYITEVPTAAEVVVRLRPFAGTS